MQQHPTRAATWRGKVGIPALILGLCATPAAAGPPASPSLKQVLVGLDRTSYLYLDTALRFSCTETVVEREFGSPRIHRFEYLFVYDKSKGFQDYRMLVSKGQRQMVNPTALGVRLFLERPYLWVLVFNRTRQSHHLYQILGTERVDGIPTIRLRFEPIPPYKESINDWYGTAWVDPTTYQIVRVQAMKTKDLEEQNQLEKDRSEWSQVPGEGPGRGYRIEQVSTDFTVIKNGMRFPGKVKIVSTLHYLPKNSTDPAPEEISQTHSTQSFTKYRFYGVRTFDEVQKILAPSGAPAR
jgi:hypothetical protein